MDFRHREEVLEQLSLLPLEVLGDKSSTLSRSDLFEESTSSSAMVHVSQVSDVAALTVQQVSLSGTVVVLNGHGQGVSGGV